MNRMIIYKEWIKTRWALLAIVVVLLGATAFTLLSLGKNVEFRGAGLLWSVLSLKDTVLIESLRYLPVFAGALLAAAQFLPETTRKRLKLTLHLPYPQGKMIAMMYGFGCCILLVLFLLQACVLGVVLNRWVVSELTVRILKTAAVWYLAGICTYFSNRPGRCVPSSSSCWPDCSICFIFPPFRRVTTGSSPGWRCTCWGDRH